MVKKLVVILFVLSVFGVPAASAASNDELICAQLAEVFSGVVKLRHTGVPISEVLRVMPEPLHFKVFEIYSEPRFMGSTAIDILAEEEYNKTYIMCVTN